MSADLVIRDAAAGPSDPDSNLQFRYENTVNTPLTAVTWLDDGRAVADQYTLVFTNSGSVTCAVTCNTKNPAYTASVAVTADGVTVNDSVVPGIGLVVSASVATGWTSVLSIGDLMDGAGAMTSRLAFGVVETDTTTSQRRIAVYNAGSDSAQSCDVTALPGVRYDSANCTTFIDNLDNHSSDARDKMAVSGENDITFTAWADGTGDDAGFKTCNILYDGDTAVTTARFDGATVYEYGVAAYDDGNDYMAGLGITLALTTSDPTSETVVATVTADQTWVELAPDVSGSPGSWGTTDVTLTESGETTGTITASGAAYFWVRLAMPSSATIGVMRGVNLKARGLTT